MVTNRQMHLIAYFKTGPTAQHTGGWRHPESTLDDILDASRYERGVVVDQTYWRDNLSRLTERWTAWKLA